MSEKCPTCGHVADTPLTGLSPCCERAWSSNPPLPPEGETVIIEHADGERRLAFWTGRSWTCEGKPNFTRIMRWASRPRDVERTVDMLPLCRAAPCQSKEECTSAGACLIGRNRFHRVAP